MEETDHTCTCKMLIVTVFCKFLNGAINNIVHGGMPKMHLSAINFYSYQVDN